VKSKDYESTNRFNLKKMLNKKRYRMVWIIRTRHPCKFWFME